MSEAQSLSYAKAQMANRLRIYQVLFRISIIANLLVGLWCIFDPVGFAGIAPTTVELGKEALPTLSR